MRKFRLITEIKNNFVGLGLARGYQMEEGKWVEYSVDSILEIIMEEINYFEPEFNSYFSLYLHADYSGISLAVDYSPDNINEIILERVENWLWENVWCEHHAQIIKQHFFLIKTN